MKCCQLYARDCLLIAETSCEMRNLFLDRSLLVPTMAADGAAFFNKGV